MKKMTNSENHNEVATATESGSFLPDGNACKNCFYHQLEEVIRADVLRAIESADAESTALMCVRPTSHGFGYMQSKADYALVILEHCKNAVSAVCEDGLESKSCYHSAAGCAQRIVNARTHHKINVHDAEDYMVMLDYVHDTIRECRYLAREGKLTVNHEEWELQAVRKI